jgi:ABC-type polar amino acid transport system ATPase subunit
MNTVPNSDLAISIKGLSKSFGEFNVLRSISLDVRRGEKIVLCGPSGSGKSTLIRCVNRLERHDSGDVHVDGIELTDEAKHVRMVRADVGMVFQHFNLFPHMTVLDNCTLAPRRVRGLKRKEAEARAIEMLERVRVAGHARKFPSQLSGGQQQRVAIARALCMSPTIMLLDEPTSALDPEMVREVLDTLTLLAQDGMTMLCVTHEMGFAKAVADRILFMDQGEIVEDNVPADFFAAPRTDRAKRFLSQMIHKCLRRDGQAGSGPCIESLSRVSEAAWCAGVLTPTMHEALRQHVSSVITWTAAVNNRMTGVKHGDNQVWHTGP